jgi:lipid A disaccharide synthetase
VITTPATKIDPAIDIVILSNGPGEVLSWVRPTVKQIRQDHPNARVSLLLVPCKHASGQEHQLATELIQIDRVLKPEHFIRFLITGRTPDGWNWHSRGVVLFLGGDQAFTWIIGKRLGYRRIIYTERDCRWLTLVDRFLCRQENVKVRSIWPPAKRKITVCGDLIQDAIHNESTPLSYHWQPQSEPHRKQFQISILPGSKPIKLRIMLPYCMRVAEQLEKSTTNISLVLFLPPNVSLKQIAEYASENNPLRSRLNGSHAVIEDRNGTPTLVTAGGTDITIHQHFPAYNQLAASDLAITTIGTITDELGKLGTPMLVISPELIYHFKIFNTNLHHFVDGLAGLLLRTPLIQRLIVPLTMKWYFRGKKRLFAWPNKKAQQEIVPEITALTAQEVGDLIIEYINNPSTLQIMRENLKMCQTQSGGAAAISQTVSELLKIKTKAPHIQEQ